MQTINVHHEQNQEHFEGAMDERHDATLISGIFCT
jgi:hypothetical protein